MDLYIENWAIWMPTVSTSTAALADNMPALAAVPAMTKRRLSNLTRMAFEVALTATSDINQGQPVQYSTLFASRHGDLHKTLGLLQQLSKDEALSPTQFTLSVHNAISGQYSLYCQNQADSSAIAAGADSLHYALLEAGARLSTEAELEQILVVYADEQPPALYLPYCQEPAMPCALAILLNKRQGTHYTFTTTAADCSPEDNQASRLMPLLAGNTHSLTLAGQQRRWHWQRQ